MMNEESIRSLLTNFQTKDRDEETARTRMLELLRAGTRSWSRYHYQPGHFTASSYVVDTLNRKIALIFHKHLNRWLQPGGHIEPEDKNILSAAQRELEEETGLVMPGLWELIDLDIHLIPVRAHMPEHFHFDLRFLHIMPPDSNIPILRAADDAVTAKWVDLEELRQHQEPGFARAVGKILSMLD